MTNEHDRDQLLAYLYGALEDDDRAALEKRLAEDEGLRAVLDEARREQALLEEAAQLPGADVVLDRKRARGRLFTLRGVGIAASILIVAGLAAAGTRVATRMRTVHENPVVTATGPATWTPGTRLPFEVRVSELGGDPVAATVEAKLFDGSGTAPTTWSAPVGDDGIARFDIEPAAPRPGEEYRLQFEATFPDGRSEPVRVTSRVRDTTRVTTRISTDKPVYRPGEPIRIRGVALESLRLTPAGDVPLRMRLLDPRGGTVFERQVPSLTGVAAWEHTLDEDAPGGTYRLELTGATGEEGLVAPSSLEVPVRKYRIPRLTFDVALDRASYGPGEEGTAWVEVERVEGGAPVGAAVETVLHVDGRETQRQTLALDSRGTLAVPFRVPQEVAEGRVRLALRVDDAGTVEGFSETVPVALGRVDLELYPEGGYLVAGLQNRVYFRATMPDGSPADLAFEVRDQGGTVASARTDVRGMGSFEMTPGVGLDYALAATLPANVGIETEMPAVRESGVVLRALEDVTAAGAPVRVSLTSTRAGEHTVGAWLRGSQVGLTTVQLSPEVPAEVEVPLETLAGGVVRVTVLDPDGVPVAERLVSRDARRTLDVTARTERGRYAPRDRVKVAVSVRDETGGPAQAILGATVVDEGVLALGDEILPLPLHFLLGMDVDEIEDADVYTGGPRAAHAVDLLLGVQGWRRFAWRSAAEFIASHPEKGPRIVGVERGDAGAVRVDTAQRASSRVRSQMRRFDRDLTGYAVLGGLVFLFVGGIVIGLRAVWQHRPWAAAGGLAMSGALLVLVLAVAFVPRIQERMVVEGMAMPRAAMEVAGADLGAAARGEAISEDKWEAGGELFDDALDHAELAQGDRRIRELEKLVEMEELELADEDADGFLRKDAKMVLTREFAHRAEPWTGERDDFTEVLYWRPLLVTGDDGTASFEFDTSDSITRFRVVIEAHDGRGALGAGRTTFENRLPFHAEPKLPVEVAAGDLIHVPVSVVNESDAPADVFVSAEIEGDLLRLADEARGLPGTRLDANGRGRVLLPLVAGHGQGSVGLRLRAETDTGLGDTVTRGIAVAPRGYPVTVSRSGSLEGSATATIVLPEQMDPTSLRGGLRVYPSTLATLVDGLDGLLQEPHGCFEQASSTTYPNVLALAYMREQGVVAPAVAARAKGLLADGYELLTGYECDRNGYEWWGADPGHEALTAYGLMEFTDMAATFDVDREMLTRTREWLLGKRDGDGGFRLQERSLDSFGGASKEVTEAYILWALTEAGDPADLTAELNVLAERAATTDDPYLLALAANTLAARDRPEAVALLARLASMQEPDGGLPGAETSITSSRGKNLLIETAALAAMAFDRNRDHLANAEAAIGFVLGQRENGRFGATQATILALRAIRSHASAAGTSEVDHDLEVVVNGETVATRHVPAGTPGVVDLGGAVLERLRTGENTIELRTTGGEALPWAAAVAFHTRVPANDPACPITVTTTLSTERAAESESVGLTATVANAEAKPTGMVVARVGYPAGLEPRVERLDELRDAGAIDFYELRPREVTLYWRGLEAEESRTVELDLTAAIPGRFEGPATSAYLYYGDDAKRWAAPLTIEIDAR